MGPRPGPDQAIDPGGRPHIPALDGVRGLAILLVMLHHFASGMAGDRGVFRAFTRVAEAGWVGVDLFFVLSGFLITGILFDARGSPHYFRNFYARRFLRIVPLYYLTLALVFLPLFRPFHSPGDGRGDTLWSRLFGGDPGLGQLWYWLYGINILLSLRNNWLPLGNYWTLAVEEHFYLLWPLAVARLDRAWLMRLAAGLFVAALALRLGMIAVFRARVSQVALFTLTPCRMDSLAVGGFLALAVRGPGGVAAVRRAAVWAMIVAAVPLVGFIARMGSLFSLTLDTLSVGLSFLAVFFAGFLALAVSAREDRPFGRLLAAPPLRVLGKYSYGLYVIHCLLWPLLPGWLPGYSREIRSGREFLGCLGYIALAGALCFALAWLSWHLLERPFLRLKRYFPDRPANPGSPETPCPTPPPGPRS